MEELQRLLPDAVRSVMEGGRGAVLDAVLDGPQGMGTEGGRGKRVLVG